MTQQPNLITLMTDFGYDDVFVGVMKGVVAGINPSARVVDVTHSITPFGVVEAAFRLAQAYPYFPKGTVHVVVVDPGVGSDRKIVAMRAGGHIFLAPDNGVLSLVGEERGRDRRVEVTERRFFLPEVSNTFHGRDIFAPVAAHIASGISLEEMGPPLYHLQSLEVPKPDVTSDGSMEGEVLWADHFGNLITNIPAEMLRAAARGREIVVEIASRKIVGLRRSYSEVGEGETLAMIGSFGMLEVAVCHGRAADKLSAPAGARVRITFT